MRFHGLVALSVLLLPVAAAQAAGDGRTAMIETRCGPTAAASARPLDLVVVEVDHEAVTVACRDGRVESLAISLAPGTGNRIELGVIYHGEQVGPLKIRAVRASDGDSEDDPGWITVQSEAEGTQPGHIATVSLVLETGSQFEPGSVRQLQLEFSVDEGRETLVVPVRLNVTEERPLFRSRFEVDPVLGQFSYRPSGRRTHRLTDTYTAAGGGE